MSQTLALNKTNIRNNVLAITGAAVIASVVLPQIFHYIGAASGLGPAVGETFLPMQLPTLLAAFIAGPIGGVIAGLLSPLMSMSICGMPAQIMLPYLMLELAGYGLAAGLLSKIKMPVLCKLVLAQIAGRILRTAAILIAVYGLGSQTMQINGISHFITAGLPGIVLQWCLIPLILIRMNSKKYNEQS